LSGLVGDGSGFMVTEPSAERDGEEKEGNENEALTD